MAIGRITGQMLSANLARSGTDLTFETNLLALDVSNSRVGIGTASPATTLHVSATDALRLPSGTTGQRPGSPANGDIRYNTTTATIEGYSNGAYANLASGTSIEDADGDTKVDVEHSSDVDEIHLSTGGNQTAIFRTASTQLGVTQISNTASTITGLVTNGDITITPNGTGEVVLSKVNVAAGEIDGTVIGANSAAAGTFTSITGTSLTVGDGNITNVGDIALDTISADGTTIGVTMTDNTAAAFDIKESSNSYLKFDTTNSSELITAGEDFTVANGKTFTTNTADINGGAIDGTTIGAASAAAGSFTTLSVSSNATITGNLTVNGTTTTIDSETLTIEDPLLTLAKNNSGGAANTFDQGLFFNRGSDDNVSFLWDESADQFAFAVTSGEDGTTAGSVTIDSYAALKGGVATFTDVETAQISAADGTTAATIANSTGVITFAAAPSFGDNNITNVGDIALDTISADGTTVGITLTDNTAAALDIKESTNSYLKFDTTNSSELITAGEDFTVASGKTFTTDTADINGGAIDGAVIGANSAAAGTFTTATATSVNATNVRANDGTAAIVLTDSTGAVAISTAVSMTGAVDVNGGNFTFNEGSASVDARFESNGDTHALFIDGSEDHVGIMTSAPAYDLDISGSTDAVRLPIGNTAQRPTGATGIIRFNSQTGKYEGCADGSTFIDFAIAGDAPTFTKESATGDGSTTTFSGFFSSAPESANNVFVYIDNVYQEPTENYSVSGTNITFTSAPHSGARIFAITGADNTALVTGGIARTESSSVNVSGSSAVTIMSFNAASYRAAELFIVTQDSGNTEFSSMKANVVHNGTTAFGTAYAEVSTASQPLVEITFEHDGSNTVNVKATANNSGTHAVTVQSSVAA